MLTLNNITARLGGQTILEGATAMLPTGSRVRLTARIGDAMAATGLTREGFELRAAAA